MSMRCHTKVKELYEISLPKIAVNPQINTAMCSARRALLLLVMGFPILCFAAVRESLLKAKIERSKSRRLVIFSLVAVFDFVYNAAKFLFFVFVHHQQYFIRFYNDNITKSVYNNGLLGCIENERITGIV